MAAWHNFKPHKVNFFLAMVNWVNLSNQYIWGNNNSKTIFNVKVLKIDVDVGIYIVFEIECWIQKEAKTFWW